MSDEWSDIPVDQGQEHLANYELLVTIGEGSFGKVMVGRHLPTDTEVAVKVIERDPDDTPLQEVSCLAVLSHPNIIRLFDVVSTTEQLFLVMEFVAEGDIEVFLRNNGRMAEDQARPVFRQLISAVDHCHQTGIIHRDIKAENVLLDSHMTAKLSDFGLGTFYDGSPLSSVCGTPLYYAPELCRGEDYGLGVDLWALGVLLYVMLTDTFPFPGTSKREVQQQILGGQYWTPCYLSPEAIDLISKLLTGIPEERENIRDFMGDTWVNLGEEQLKPYVEQPRGVTHLDPWVAGEMVNLGYSVDEIETALATRAYSRVSATYYILLARADKSCRYCTTPVEPFHPLQSRSPSPAQPSSKAESTPEASLIMAPSRAWRTLSPPSSPEAASGPVSDPEAAASEPEPEAAAAAASEPQPEAAAAAAAANAASAAAAASVPTQEAAAIFSHAPPGRPRDTATALSRETAAIFSHAPPGRPGDAASAPGRETASIFSHAPPSRHGDSSSSHSLSSSSGDEEPSHGRRLARRCLKFIRRVFCIPRKNGRWRQKKVAPV